MRLKKRPDEEGQETLTLRQTLVGQGDLTGQQVEVKAREDAAERRDGDEAVGGARLQNRHRQSLPGCTLKKGGGAGVLLTLTKAAVLRE